MVEKLKEITQTKIGFEISTLSDCKRLSAIILTVTDSYISYNTLRRLFGIIKMVKPSEFTLDAISKFNDFKNYNDFLINYNLRNKYYEEFKEKPTIDLKTGLYNFYQYAKKNWK